MITPHRKKGRAEIVSEQKKRLVQLKQNKKRKAVPII